MESLMAAGTLAIVAISAPTVPQTSAELEQLGATYIEIRAFGGDRVVLYGSFPNEEAARIVVQILRQRGWSAVQRPADDDPWLAAWRGRTQPVLVGGRRLMVCLPWTEVQRGDIPTIEIDPGGAFGAGSHPTTQLILEILAARLHGGERVLDVGCGSGALALAAVRLGAASALGTDIDPAAVIATRANAERNGLVDRVSATAAPLQELNGTFDVVVANIGREVLMELAPDMEARLAPGGWLALSGISPAQVSILSTAFHHTRMTATAQLDDWCAVVGEKID
jgi:ribosomal protein L11 methyltransferase